MTSFGDVNVGDKVRLTHNEKTHIRHEFTVEANTANMSSTTRFLSDEVGWSYFDDTWSVEVLEPAPKPLPTEPGLYVRAGGESAHFELEPPNGWWTDPHGTWTSIPVEEVPRDLVRLVPSTAVEEARAEVVKEIVKFLYRHDDRSWDVAANKVDLKFLGGKA